jgi:hypothetical protein
LILLIVFCHSMAVSTSYAGSRPIAAMQTHGNDCSADNGVLRALPERHRGAAAAQRSFQLIQRFSCLAL